MQWGKNLFIIFPLLILLYPVHPFPQQDIAWYWCKGDNNEFAKLIYPQIDWERVVAGTKFRMREGEKGWLWTRITIPAEIAGKETKGHPVSLHISTGEGGEIYVDGELQSRYDNDHPGAALLTKFAIPGENHIVAVRVFGPVSGEKEIDFSEGELKIVPFDKVNAPCEIHINPLKIIGALPRPLCGLSQGGGMVDYEPDTAKALSKLRPRWFRMDNVLTSVVREEEGKLVYDWSDFDKRVDFIFQTGAEPILCLSYMPIPFDAVPDPERHSAPKDYSLWEDLCYRAAKRCLERGKRVRYWEVWNEANAGWLKPPPNETPLEAYLKLYEASAKGIRKADPTAFIGGPCNASGPWDYSPERPYCVNGETFLKGLVRFCAEKNLPLDFITWHEYFHPPNVYIEEMEKTREILSEYPSIAKKIRGFFITEFNYAWWHDFAQDNEVGASWVANNVIRAGIPSGITALCYFYAKDSDNRFRGSWGILMGGNAPKPAYFVYQFFSMMENKRIEVKGGDEAICALASISEDRKRLTIIIVNFAERYCLPRRIRLTIKPLPFIFRGGKSRLYLVDPKHNNLFYNPEIRELECNNEGVIPSSDAWVVNMSLLPNSVVFIEGICSSPSQKSFP